MAVVHDVTYHVIIIILQVAAAAETAAITAQSAAFK